jgi:hypothetical protein
VAGVGLAGCALFALGLAGRWPSLLGLGLAGVGAAYAVFLSLRIGGVDANAPAVGAGLFVAAELGFWSLERRLGALLVRRIVVIVLLGLGSALAGSLILVASAAVSGGVGLEALGVVAAIAVLGSIAALAARARGSTST